MIAIIVMIVCLAAIFIAPHVCIWLALPIMAIDLYGISRGWWAR